MKSRIICLCLCLAALCISMIMTINLINSEEYKHPAENPSGDTPPTVTPSTDYVREDVALNDKGLSSFAKVVENYVDTLAFGDKKDYDAIEYIVKNLERVSEYLASTEVGNKLGSDYMATLAESFGTVKTGFVDDSEFSIKVSAMLADIESDFAKLDGENSDIYPVLDTAPNGSFTLAMLAVHDNASLVNDGSRYTVTVGGGILLGDKLGTEESLKFSSQLDKHTYNYPLYKLSALTLNDNLTLASLEAPLTTSVDSESTNPAKGSPEYAARLMGIDAVSLASDNIMEYGEDGLNETAKALKDNGISYSIQESSQSVTSDFGKVVYITFDLTDTPVSDEQRDRNKEVVKNAITAERENGAELVIVMLHWNTRQRASESPSADYLGTQVSAYEAHFDAYNKDIARAAIGSGVGGADLVVGYGSRVAQGIELYNNKMIVYSTGDLSYSGELEEGKKNTDYSFLFRQTFAKGDNGMQSLSFRVIPVVNTSEESLYCPQPVFDSQADEIIDIIAKQSSYFANPLDADDLNYIKINK